MRLNSPLPLARINTAKVAGMESITKKRPTRARKGLRVWSVAYSSTKQ